MTDSCRAAALGLFLAAALSSCAARPPSLEPAPALPVDAGHDAGAPTSDGGLDAGPAEPDAGPTPFDAGVEPGGCEAPLLARGLSAQSPTWQAPLRAQALRPAVGVGCVAPTEPRHAQVWVRVVAGPAGRYLVGLQHRPRSSWPGRFQVADALFANAAACEVDCPASLSRSSGASLVLQAAEERLVRVVFDTRLYGEDELSLQVSLCTPRCEGRVCGSDGCGGSCGACDAGDDCAQDDGTCGPSSSTPGARCTSALDIDPLALPYTSAPLPAAALTQGHLQLPRCLGFGHGAQLFRLAPVTSGYYQVGLDTLAPDGGLASSSIGEVVVASRCDSLCDTVLASSASSLEVYLRAGHVYTVAASPSVHFDPSLPFVVTVSAPCVPVCAGRDCGLDQCGHSCGVCSSPAGEECLEDPGQCVPLTAACGQPLAGSPCTTPASTCTQSCGPVPWCAWCVYQVCRANSAGEAWWVNREFYPPTACDLSHCGTLPATVAFTWSPDFTRADAYIPLDPATGVCGLGHPSALWFGSNAQHAAFVKAVGGWQLLSASHGQRFAADQLVMNLPSSVSITVQLASPTGATFTLVFQVGAAVTLLSKSSP